MQVNRSGREELGERKSGGGEWKAGNDSDTVSIIADTGTDWTADANLPYLPDGQGIPCRGRAPRTDRCAATRCKRRGAPAGPGGGRATCSASARFRDRRVGDGGRCVWIHEVQLGVVGVVVLVRVRNGYRV